MVSTQKKKIISAISVSHKSIIYLDTYDRRNLTKERERERDTGSTLAFRAALLPLIQIDRGTARTKGKKRNQNRIES